MDTLIPELLEKILKDVYHGSQNRSSGSTANSTSGGGVGGGFVDCLLVCRRWRDHGLPILYRNLKLTNRQLSRFLETPGTEGRRQAVRTLTHTLSIHLLRPEQPPWTSQEEATAGFEAVHIRVGALLRRMAKDMLLSRSPSALWRFRLTVPGGSADAALAWVSRRDIAAVLRALPEGCADVDIDTDGKDVDRGGEEVEEGGQGVHLCVEFCNILPRLRRLRVRMHSVCGALVSDVDRNGGLVGISLPPSAELVVVVNCVLGWRLSQCCRQAARSGSASPPPSSWHSVIPAMRQVRVRNGANVEMVVVGMVRPDDDLEDRSLHKTALRCHVVVGKRGNSDDEQVTTTAAAAAAATFTWAFPVLDLPRQSSHKQWPYHIRTDAGGFVAFGAEALRRVIEGSAGSDEEEDDDRGTQRLIWAGDEWRATFRGSCTLWANEKLSGMRLLDAIKREDFGLDKYRLVGLKIGESNLWLV